MNQLQLSHSRNFFQFSVTYINFPILLQYGRR
jgi:hypothetical protein